MPTGQKYTNLDATGANAKSPDGHNPHSTGAQGWGIDSAIDVQENPTPLSQGISVVEMSTGSTGVEVNPAQVPDVIVAVMGSTGSGKSSFINVVSESNLPVSDGLYSCTTGVMVSKSFELDGQTVALIDTPGFDDSSMTDAEVLGLISAFLATTYEHGQILSGILYFHPIHNTRMGGISGRNFRMFRKLCGDDAFKNVVIVTNMWGLTSSELGGLREEQLSTEDDLFKPVLDKGAKMKRHLNTKESAQDILRTIIRNHPVPLCIQHELVDQKKDISNTAAGSGLESDAERQLQRIQGERRKLETERQEAIDAKDEQTKKEVDRETQKLLEQENRMRGVSRELGYNYGLVRSLLMEQIRQGRRKVVFVAGCAVVLVTVAGAGVFVAPVVVPVGEAAVAAGGGTVVVGETVMAMGASALAMGGAVMAAGGSLMSSVAKAQLAGSVVALAAAAANRR